MTLFLVSCGGGGDAKAESSQQPTISTPTMQETYTGYTSSWWERPQYYNGVPKYSGAFGTYTHKHIPVAVEHDGDLFSVRTDNTEDDNFYVYAMKNGASVKVHTIENWDDPHTNASINLDRDGYVWVHIASRGLAHKFQSGKILKSQTPYKLDFECVDGCSDFNINYEAYPQIHKTAWGMHLIYTHYESGDNNESHRMLWSRVGSTRTKLSKLAHYNVSAYDSENNGRLCVASNTLLNSSPDMRVNISVICTRFGTSNWTDINRSLINFNSDDESNRIVYNTEIKGAFVYLKDIIFINGKLRVLFTESTTDDPTTGARWLSEWVQGKGVSKITQVGHNYSAGAYLKKDGKLYIVAGISNSTGYLSGSLELYDTDYNLIDTLQGDYSYVRRVRGADGKAVMSQGASDIKVSGKHYNLELK